MLKEQQKPRYSIKSEFKCLVGVMPKKIYDSKGLSSKNKIIFFCVMICPAARIKTKKMGIQEGGVASPTNWVVSRFVYLSSFLVVPLVEFVDCKYWFGVGTPPSQR